MKTAEIRRLLERHELEFYKGEAFCRQNRGIEISAIHLEAITTELLRYRTGQEGCVMCKHPYSEDGAGNVDNFCFICGKDLQEKK